MSGESADRDGALPQVKTLGKAFALLDAVAEAEFPPTVSEVAAQVAITRPTAHRLVETLREAGYIDKGDVDGRLSVGYAVLRLAASQLDNNRLRLDALPHLQTLAQKINERVNLGILYRSRVLVIGGVEKPDLPTIYSRFGRIVPLHCCGLGKAMLSAMDDADLPRMVGPEPYLARTPNTITSLHALQQELAAIRARGYATELQENSPNSCCIAAPILNHEELPVGAISVTGRSLEALQDKAGELLRAVEMISHLSATSMTRMGSGYR